MIRPCIKSSELESNKILIFYDWLWSFKSIPTKFIYQKCSKVFSASQQKIFETVHFDAKTYLFILQNRSHANTNSCSAVTYTDYWQLGGRDLKEGILYTTLSNHNFSTFQLMLGEVSLKISWTLLKLFSIKKCKMLFWMILWAQGKNYQTRLEILMYNTPTTLLY